MFGRAPHQAVAAARAAASTKSLPLDAAEPAEASPVGAHSAFTTDDGALAWLAVEDGNVHGYARTDPADAGSTHRYATVEDWTAAMEAVEVTETDVPDTDPADSTGDADDDEADDEDPGMSRAEQARREVLASRGGGGAGDGPSLFDDAPPEGKAGGPPIASGSYVAWGSGGGAGRGRVDLIVTDGKVPGVSEDVQGTSDSPAARVVVYEQRDGKWRSTGNKRAAKVSTLRRTPPLTATSSKGLDLSAALVKALAEHHEQVTSNGTGMLPDGDAVTAVADRGVKSWPGADATTLSREEWALQRSSTFLAVCAGHAPPPGWRRDRDLLPDGHPERVT